MMVEALRLREISLEPEKVINSVEYVGYNGLPTFRVDYVVSNPNHPGTKMVRIYRKREGAEEQVAAFRFTTDASGEVSSVDCGYIPDVNYHISDHTFYALQYFGEEEGIAGLTWVSRLEYDSERKQHIQTAGGYRGSSTQFEELRKRLGFPQEIDLIKTVSMYVSGIYENEKGQVLPLTAERIAQMPVVATSLPTS